MASQTKKAPPKGILKKPTVTASPSPSPSASASPSPQQKPDPREIAIQHAKIIHDRRALEDTITDSIILLAKLPTSKEPSSSPSQTTRTTTTTTASSSTNDYSEQDAELFKSHVRLFQPSDYDALIEERNALGSCGYGLCGRPRTRLGPGAGDYKLLNWGRRDFAIVPRAEAERWCSRRCARRAMYVKVQLSETAAWERAGIETIRIELLEEQQDAEQERQRRQKVPEKEKGEDEDAAAAAAAAQVARDETDRRQKAAKDAMDLALERGDTDKKRAAKRRINVTIREKKVVAEVREPSLAAGGGDDGHLVLDGYKTKFDPKSETINGNKGSTTIPDAKEDDDGKATE
ncbi:hypothetical protein DL767_003025 [Monosporascus sp. MG133]|nr:hypothetical protein DL767_003025 [Monosporascus sp. MG133]